MINKAWIEKNNDGNIESIKNQIDGMKLDWQDKDDDFEKMAVREEIFEPPLNSSKKELSNAL